MCNQIIGNQSTPTRYRHYNACCANIGKSAIFLTKILAKYGLHTYLIKHIST